MIMFDFAFICEMKKITSKKNGSEYIILEITFPNGVKKVLFPQGGAEQFLFSETYKLLKGE